MLDPRNAQHGFWGTTQMYLKDKGRTHHMWVCMFATVKRWVGDAPGMDVDDLTLAYLDGKPGRHLADFCQSRGWKLTITDVEGYLNDDRSSLLETAHELAPVAYVEE